MASQTGGKNDGTKIVLAETQETDIQKKLIGYKDLFAGDFWRYFLKAIWLFFPSIVFLILAYFCFWKLSQGKDVMIITLENRKVFGLFLLALIFWVLITWYTSRLLGKAKRLMVDDPHPLWRVLSVQTPRLLSYTCISIVLLAFFQLPYPETPHLSSGMCHLLLLASFPLYSLQYKFISTGLEKLRMAAIRSSIIRWQKVRLATYITATLATLIVVYFRWIWGMIVLLIFYQFCFLVFILIRRNIIDAKQQYSFQNKAKYDINRKASVWKKIAQLVFDKEDKQYFIALNSISIVAAVIYLATIFSVSFSTWIGSFPFLLLAFGVLLGLGNLVALFSVIARFNFHILLISLAFLVGLISEPHYTRLTTKRKEAPAFADRQNLEEYFESWLSDSTRLLKITANDSSKFPLYFVMANGGASRSGYWVASVLSKMEDETQGKFSEHLFCLSGASGGSVGNACFFSLLKAKANLQQFDSSPDNMQEASKQYLRSDFLTFTLARTLGPDIFRNFITLYKVSDRASALSFALENAPGKKVFLNDSMGVNMSAIITQKKLQYHLPLLMINTTRMQDGSPGIISNIKIEDPVFNKRVDVLSLLDANKDMKLSTAMVLGASFPYLSPAGRIDHKPCDTCTVEPNYFVDGGYFDNSGSGAVFEIIFALKQFLDQPKYAAIKDRIDFHIIHITNDREEDAVLKKVNPFTNDLAAPVKTLLGAYGTQTAVNDFRLQKYIASIHEEQVGKGHYNHLSLYTPKDKMDYTMSWVISKHVLNAMDKRLNNYKQLDSLIQSINNLE